MPAARVDKADNTFLVPLIEPLRDAVELTGSGLVIWDEICASPHGIATAELIEKTAALYSTDVHEIGASVRQFVVTLHDQGLIIDAADNPADE